MESPTTTSRHASFNPEWENTYACSQINEKIVCLLCGLELSTEISIQRHHQSRHPDFSVNFPLNSQVRVSEILSKKSEMSSSIDLNLCNDNSSTRVLMSFQVAQKLVKDLGSFEDIEVYQNFFADAMRAMFGSTHLEARINRFVDNLELSRSAIAERIESIADDLESQILNDLAQCDYFSCQVVAASHLSDQVQVIVFVRMIFHDLSTREDLFTIFSVSRNHTDLDLHKAFKKEFLSVCISLDKLAGITTDGSSIMSGFVAQCRADPDFPRFKSFHCVLHRLSLCCEEIQVKPVITSADKIVELIISEGSNQRLSELFGDEDNLDELFCYSGVDWLRKRSMLQKFYDNFGEIVDFLKTSDKIFPELCHPDWLSTLAYIVDLNQLISWQTREMEDTSNYLHQNFESIEELKSAMEYAVDSFEDNSISDLFPRLKNLVSEDDTPFDSDKFLVLTDNFLESLMNRFGDVTETQWVINYLRCSRSKKESSGIVSSVIWGCHPVNFSDIANEIGNLPVDDDLSLLDSEVGTWQRILQSKSYPNLLKVYKRIRCSFTTTRLCDRAIFHMSQISSKQSVLSNCDIKKAVLLCVSSRQPDLHGLAARVLD
ncbi:uncharacterized protein [Fopius arisanus]|uniref:C2H2-type domain-containing protein n=1 Tax=Fopius arisanus TaxID=64838 RepID=A0A9R1TAW1_9HYME|nr:PREDICTED: uncharacterized protein LOC105268292 [Fopius arisanus]